MSMHRIMGITKVHPNTTPTFSSSLGKLKKSSSASAVAGAGADVNIPEATVLTVWKKSLLLNCNGFTVYDGKGNLLFRVDNYSSGNRGEIVLMDSYGKPLLTIRRKRLSIGESWQIYEGETKTNPKFVVRKQVNLLNSKSLAQVISTSSTSKNSTTIMYEIEGSYGQRNCTMYDQQRRVVAQIKRKDSVGGAKFGDDVFRLIVTPEIDSPVAMAFVILLDQMFRPRFSS